MTLEERLAGALARRGHQRLSQFIANALGLQCGAHHAGAVCGFYATDNLTVERLERYADQLALREPSRAPGPIHAQETP